MSSRVTSSLTSYLQFDISCSYTGMQAQKKKKKQQQQQQQQQGFEHNCLATSANDIESS